MSRIRTIKPEFFTSADIVELTPLARLFYVSLWCEADREGRLNWNTKTLKMRYLPADDCSIDDLASELINRGLIEIYEVDGKNYAEIPSFSNHQVINNREKESVIPDKTHDATFTRESGVSGEGKEGRKGRERKGKEERVKGTRLKNDWVAPKEFVDYCEVNYPAVDSFEALNQFKDYWIAKSGKDGVKIDWLATWRNWLRNGLNLPQKKNRSGEHDKSYMKGVIW